MRLSLSLLTALSAASGLVAQANNTFWNYASDESQTCTTWTDRHGVGGPEFGWACKRFANFCAIGNDGDGVNFPGGALAGFTAIIQDQDRATPSNYAMAIATEDPTNPGNPALPLTGSSTIVATSGLVPTPSTSGSGAVAWRVTFTLATANVLPSRGVLYQGVFFTPTPTWTADGLSWQAAWGTAGAGYSQNPSGAPNFTTTVNETTNLIVNPGAGQVNRNPHGGILTPQPLLDVGAEVDPSVSRCPGRAVEWGVTSAYLNNSIRADGAVFRVRDVNNPVAPVGVLMSIGSLPASPAPVRGIKGLVCVDLAGLLPFAVAQGALGAGGVPGEFVDGSLFGFASANKLPPGSYHFQAAVLTGAGACMTNAVGVVVD